MMPTANKQGGCAGSRAGLPRLPGTREPRCPVSSQRRSGGAGRYPRWPWCSHLTRRYLHGLAAHSTWSAGALLTLRSGSGSAGPPAAGQLTGQVLLAEPLRQLSYLLRSGPHDPPTFLTWRLRTVPGGTTLRLQIDEVEGSSDDDAEDTWLPVLVALHALLDPAASRTKPATGEQSGPMSAAPIV
jgi:hypothetical protein